MNWAKVTTKDPDGGRSFLIPATLEYIEIDKLFVDYHESVLSDEDDIEEATLAYQRKQHRVEDKIVEKGLDPNLFGALMVNERQPGQSYAITDGGTRYRAAKRLQIPGDVRIPCLVYKWKPMEEIQAYVDFNQERAGLTPVDVFMAQVKCKDAEALVIEKILMEYSGSSISARKGDWQCVNAIREAHKHGNLEMVLHIMEALNWLDAPSGRTQQVVGAIDRCLEAGADSKRCIDRWKKLTPVIIKSKSTQLQSLGDIGSGSRSIAKYYAIVLGAEYDRRTAKTLKLDMATRLFSGISD